MYFTYVLRCIDNQNKWSFYTGFTKIIDNRVTDHISKSVETTKRFVKIELVYYEACLNETDARRREIQLKTGFGRGYLKRRLNNYIKSLRD